MVIGQQHLFVKIHVDTTLIYLHHTILQTSVYSQLCFNGQYKGRLLLQWYVHRRQTIKFHQSFEQSTDNGTGTSQTHLFGNVCVVTHLEISLAQCNAMQRTIFCVVRGRGVWNKNTHNAPTHTTSKKSEKSKEKSKEKSEINIVQRKRRGEQISNTSDYYSRLSTTLLLTRKFF